MNGVFLTLAVGCVLVATLTVLPLLLFHTTTRESDTIPATPLLEEELSVRLQETVTFSIPLRLLVRETETAWPGKSRAMKS